MKVPRKAPFNPSRVLNVPPEAPECPKVELWRCQKRTTERQKTPVVEHKGIVERPGVFSLATSARSVASIVGQITSHVRLMFDAGSQRRKMSKNAFLSCYM